MTRAQLNTNGATPLADTTLGTAGTVLGTERSWVQQISAFVSRAATVPFQVLGSFWMRGLGFIPASDNPASHSLHQVNAANTIENWYITEGGVFSGSSNSLTAGTADGDKLHNIGTALSASLGGNIALSLSYQTIVSISLPAGTWLVTAELEIDTTVVDFTMARIRNQTDAVTYSAGTDYMNQRGHLHLGAIVAILGGTKTFALEAERGTTGGFYNAVTTSVGGDSPATRIQAVRVA
jgi:hypothetical protein